MSAIKIDILNKRFPGVGEATGHLVIENLNLTINPQEFVCLVGPSGCGKTTLLNIIAGLDTDFTGEISVGQVTKQSKIGVVFQNPRLLAWRTVRQNIELVQERFQNAELIDELLDVMQLTVFQNVYPERLSLGMSRRVALIRAFAVNPDLLLMDEPFVSLDAPTARQVRDLLLLLWKKRPHTVLFVTHDLREAIALADRLVFLSAAPMGFVADIKVSIPRTERNNEQAIEDFRQQLINEYPAIKQLI